MRKWGKWGDRGIGKFNYTSRPDGGRRQENPCQKRFLAI
jgi:hypothetical protein